MAFRSISTPCVLIILKGLVPSRWGKSFRLSHVAVKSITGKICISIIRDCELDLRARINTFETHNFQFFLSVFKTGVDWGNPRTYEYKI